MKGNKHRNTGGAALSRLMLPLLSAAFLLAGLSSCDRVIYDYEGDCSVHYMVRFRYDYNMKWADAFAHEVECVTLYVIDSDGNIVLEQSEEGPALGVEGYEMEIEVDPGVYSLLAWCGTKDNGSFTVPQTSLATGLTCTLGCKDDGQGLYVDGEVDRLYYGWLEDQDFTATEGTQTVVLPLVKDTNTIQVMLQQVSGEELDPDDFTFEITADNWAMDWDNSLIADEEVTYYPFYTARVQTDIETKAGTRASSYSGVIAEFTLSRLVDGHDVQLTVLNNETGAPVLSIPLIDIVVLVKGYYNRSLDDQEYLDRQDEYSLVFFLDEYGNWINAYIYINAWKVVLQENGL